MTNDQLTDIPTILYVGLWVATILFIHLNSQGMNSYLMAGAFLMGLLLSSPLFAQRSGSADPIESQTATLEKGKQDFRFPAHDLVLEMDYDRNDASYTAKIPGYKPKAQTVYAHTSPIQLRFEGKKEDVVLTIKAADDQSSSSGRQKNRRVEMTIVFE